MKESSSSSSSTTKWGLKEAKVLAMKVLAKTMDSTKLSSENCKCFLIVLFFLCVFLFHQ